MIHPGRNPFKGTDYQTLAALSLFLQHLREPAFRCINLESPPSIDFELIFTDGHKTICEAKDWAGGLQNHDIELIVDKLRKCVVGKDDEILIICNKCSVDVGRLLEKLRSSENLLENEFRLWTNLRIWEQTREILEHAVYILFSEIIPFWLPDQDIKEFADSIRLQKFHRGSAEGAVIKKDDFEAATSSLQLRVSESGSRFNEIRSFEEQIDQIISDVKEGKPKSGDRDIATLSQKPGLMMFLLDKLTEQGDIDLRIWDRIWQSCRVFYYPHKLFDLFSRNLRTKENRQYVLSFLEQSLDQLNRFYYDTFFEHDLATLLTAIATKDKSLHQAVLDIIKQQFEKYDSELFYLSTTKDALLRKSELSSSLQSLYSGCTRELKEQVYEFIIDTFNLIDDGGDSTLYTPDEVFRIVRHYLNYDSNRFFERKFLKLSKQLACQYEKFHQLKFGKRYAFNGWDAIGIGGAFWGYNYKVFDRHFILKILVPALQDFDESLRWGFVKRHCIIEHQNVSKERPDFLNRAAIPFVLDEFKKGNREGFQILREFLLSGGIPHKTELIYQYLARDNFTDEQKWQLVEISIKNFAVPEPFIEQIVGDLASNGHEQATNQLRVWSQDPTYYIRTSFFHAFIPNIQKLLDSALSDAIQLFESLIANQYFVQGFDHSNVREVSELLSGIIVRNPNEGWKIWDEVRQRENVTINQQLLITGSLLALSETNNQVATEKAFAAADTLTSDYEKFTSEFFYSYSRELVVQFLDKCASKDHFDPTRCLKIIPRFVEDADPANENDANDPKGEFNYHKQILEGKSPLLITSVRGWIPWVIQRIIRVGIEDNVDELINLTRNLTKDRNLYVRLQSCVALTRLAQTRLSETVAGKRFMTDEQAKQIEAAAFDMLSQPENARPALQGAMARVFNFFRIIDFDCAMNAVGYFADADFEALREYLSTIIYFAELSENFSLEQRLKFSDVIFRLIEKNSDTKAAIAWLMWSLSNEKSEAGESYLAMTLKYVHKIVQTYDQQAFTNIYSLIMDHINDTDYQKELLSVYKECLVKELQYLKAHPEDPKRLSAPYYENGEMLEIIFGLSKEDFLWTFKILLQYPIECYIGDIHNAIELLFQIPQSSQADVEDIFGNLVKRFPLLYEKKKLWEENTKSWRT